MRSLLALFLLAPSFAFAAETSPIMLSDGWSPASFAQPNAIGFFTAMNHGEANDAITGVSSDCCKAVELHQSQMHGDVMRMRRMDRVELPAGETVHFTSGGYHLMLIGLKKPLSKGDKVPVTVTFEHAPTQELALTVGNRKDHDAAMHHAH